MRYDIIETDNRAHTSVKRLLLIYQRGEEGQDSNKYTEWRVGGF